MSRIAIGVAAAAGLVGIACYYHQQTRRNAAADASEEPEKISEEIAPSASASSSSSSSSPSSTLLVGVSSSASSKVLLTGGYLILESAYSGLVLSLSARFHTEVFRLTKKEQIERLWKDYKHDADDGIHPLPIIIYAPQRSSKPLRYFLKLEDSSSDRLTLIKGNNQQETNKFVEFTILYTLLYLSRVTSFSSVRASLSSGLLVYLEGDFPFYTSVAPTVTTDSNGVPPVVPDGSKTGLGSSAALVASMVAGLVQSLQPDLTSQTHILHNLAQFIHCAAQGKVGSGFDVSTAYYGSQIYQRFEVEVIQNLVELAGSSPSSPLSSSTLVPSSLLSSTVTPRWSNHVEPFTLPPGLTLMLADVAGGASTPTMVKMVLQWRKDKLKSNLIWTKLAESNALVSQHFATLSQLARELPEEYHSVRRKLSQYPSYEWDLKDSSKIGSIFTQLSRAFYAVRHHLRSLGEATGADIEPLSQQGLLDETIRQPGTLLAGVPGAGGEDAIFVIVMDESLETNVEATWKKYQFPTQQDRVVRRLPVHAETRQIINNNHVERDIAKWNF